MTKKKTTKSTTSKKKQNETVRNIFIQAVLIIVCILLAFFVVNDIRTYQNLQESISDNRRLLAKTKEEEQQLELTKRNLTNPDYLEFVARGRYYASRPGEQVFVFPDLAKEYSQADDEFYDDEILREEEASKNQSLQQAAQNNANNAQSGSSLVDSFTGSIDSGLEAPSEETVAPVEEALPQEDQTPTIQDSESVLSENPTEPSEPEPAA